MARVSSAPEGGKFRARAAASIDAEDALWGAAAGSENLLCVEVDASGELVLATGPDCDGVIDVTEGKRAAAESLATFRQVIGGKRYTVLQRAHIQDVEDGTLAVGDRLYADSGDPGNVRVGTAGGAGDSYVGVIVADETDRGGSGLVLILDVNNLAAGTA